MTKLLFFVFALIVLGVVGIGLAWTFGVELGFLIRAYEAGRQISG